MKRDSPRTFNCRPQHYDQALSDSTAARAVPAVLNSHDGAQRPGIALFGSHNPRLVITTDAALRLAHSIADTLADMNNETDGSRQNAAGRD